MVVVDAHLHVFKAVSERYPRAVADQFPAALEGPVEPFIDLMDANGVDHAVLVPLSPHDAYTREVVAAYPERFAWVGVHDPASTDPVRDLARRSDGTGMRGLRIFHLGSPDVDDVRSLELFPLLEAMQEQNQIIWFYGAPDQQQLLVRVLESLPGLTIMLNHLGFSPTAIGTNQDGRPTSTELPTPSLPVLQQLARADGVHVMFSGQYAFSSEPFPYRDLAEEARAIYYAFGARRLAWASDYPWIAREPGYDRSLELVDALLPDLSADDRAQILGGTAARMFGFAAGPSPSTPD